MSYETVDRFEHLLDEAEAPLARTRIGAALKRHIELYPDVLYSEGTSARPAAPTQHKFDTDKKDL